MIIAQKKRKENIAEYLLYMWQVEDLIRAVGVTIEGVETHLLPRYQVDEATKAEIRTWYSELIDMMLSTKSLYLTNDSALAFPLRRSHHEVRILN